MIQEIVQDEKAQKTKIVVSRRTARIMKAKLKERDVTKDIWDQLEAEIKLRFKNSIDSLQDVLVSVATPYKFQVGVEFDWVNETTELLSDLSEWNETEGKPDDRQKVKIEALSFIAETMQLQNKTTFATIDKQDEITNSELRTKLEGQNNQDSLAVMRGASYYVEETELLNAEDVTANIHRLEIKNVANTARDYYQEYKTFAGFFDKHKKFNRKRTRIQGEVLSAERPLDCSGVFIKAFKDTPNGEAEIEAVSFEYRSISGEWIIRTPNYSRRVRDAFISELHKLSKESSGYPKPEVRDTPSTVV